MHVTPDGSHIVIRYTKKFNVDLISPLFRRQLFWTKSSRQKEERKTCLCTVYTNDHDAISSDYSEEADARE